ncbi:hypothetical protein PUV54_16085 [Hyphococcus flavus]|uniref:Uncharacterized protein n=1 Tax=Hyphococcus flavus TaxID=1866326 RepID=A0AAE9ZBY0_9PROT|nr:hypothetical protein [Hyphococcus flavus]WDI31471.1 hypothetical protein PUV54_16085 [Hyphococcus flavus]
MPSSTSSSKPQLARPFDDDVVRRPVPERPWRGLAIISVIATIALMVGWELYWRANWHIPGDFKNTTSLWAEQRRNAKGDATVLIGSSRILFDTDLNVWENTVGVRPIQLALEGTSPQPVLADLAADEEFNGLVVVGVTAPLTFSGYAYRGDVIEEARNEAPFERAGHVLWMQLEKLFAYTDEATRPKTMVFYAGLPLREGMRRRMEPRKLEIMNADRNTEMWSRVVDDPAYQQLARDVWGNSVGPMLEGLKDPNSPAYGAIAEQTNKIIAELGADIEKIRARGGDVVFARMPYDGLYEEIEEKAFPREKAWDKLLAETNSIGVHFKDYEALQGFYIVEWSHLAPRDAEAFTAAFVPILYEQMDTATGASAD